VERRNSYIQVPIIVGKQYIDFKKFCEIMKVFHYKCEVEKKIDCKIIFNLIYVVYFELYDTDGDGKITKKDLKTFFSVINTIDVDDVTKVSKSKLNTTEDNIDIEAYIDPMIAKIMKELLVNTNRTYIDNRDFRNLMWNTNIDKTCVIYLEDD
jgi:Ca2+-binding EF-hand superfamily protein